MESKIYHMKKTVIIIAILIVAVAGIFLALYFLGLLNPKSAGLLVSTTPKATVYIDGVRVGQTPYEAVRKAGEIVVKLVPDVQGQTLASYESKISLVSGVQTVITRDFGVTENESGGAVISFERIGAGEVELASVSWPDNAEVSIDGQIRGFTPYKTSSLASGDHTLLITADGYLPRELSVKTHQGYKLTAQVRLAKTELGPTPTPFASSPTPSPSPTPAPKVQIKILDTPTGFLRVRSGPSASEVEVGRVTPGQVYTVIEKSEDNAWYKIEYKKGSFGYISAKYAQVFTGTISPSPSATPR